MTYEKTVKWLMVVVASAALLSGAGNTYAFNFGNMMNPSKWMPGGGNKRYDYYDDYRGGPGYGYGAPGYGYGAPGYGYGTPGYGYGAPGYGYGAPGYTTPGYSAPALNPPASTSQNAEIKELKQRIKELEDANARPAPSYGAQPGYQQAPGSSYSSQPKYGTQPSYGSQPSYGTQPSYEKKSGYGSQSGSGYQPSVPAYGK